MARLLAKLTRLEWLYLGHTQITDAGLVHLARLTKLRYLSLKPNPQITDTCVKKLQKALPKCMIER